MRKTLALLAVIGFVAALGAPAAAGGKKKIHDTFGASLMPFPKLAAWGDYAGIKKPGCSAGQENVHWVGVEFTAPAKGTMRLWSEGFTGDHDIYIFDGDLAIGKGENSQVPDGAAPEEEITLPLKKKQTVLLVACNWLGQAEVLAHYEFTFTK